jgi:hypothetical protein
MGVKAPCRDTHAHDTHLAARMGAKAALPQAKQNPEG